MRPRKRASWTGLSLVAGLCALPSAGASDPVADFYRSKTVRIIIGYAAGGGYDLYGRIAAEFFGRYIPGNPTVVAQNMPGAGSFLAAKYMYAAAPQDGTVLGCLAQTLPLDAAMGEDKDLDISKMPYIGRLADSIDLGAGIPGAKFKDIEDARSRELVVGATGGSSPAFLLPTALNRFGGTKFKIVAGYKGSADVLLAAERGEVDVIGSISIASILVRNPDWIRERKAPILYQNALSRHPLLPHVPALPELGQSEDGKAVLRAIAASAEVGRSLVTTPNVPPERLAALRKAYQDMTSDLVFRETMAKRDILIEPMSGEQLDQIARQTMHTPPKVLALTKELVKLGK